MLRNWTTEITLLAVLGWGGLAPADWWQFRGPGGNGLALEAEPPAELSEETLAWSTALPGRGLSSLILVGERVFVTASSGPTQDRLHVLCLSADTGAIVWERQFWATGRTTTHDKTSVAAPTPCSDGERIYATFSSNDVACLDLDGNLEWFRGLTWDYPNASNSLGMSSSPVVSGETLVVMTENDDQSFTVGLDVRTGVSRWMLERPRKANWTSPVVMQGATDREDLVLLQSSKGVTAINPSTGATEWTYADGASTIPSSVVDGETAYLVSHGITAVRRGRSDPATPEILWQEGALDPSTASPVAFAGRLYLINRAGALTCADQKDGKRVWQKRLTGPFSGSPVIAAGRLYAVNEKGLAQVVQLEADGAEVVSTYELADTVLSTPAIADQAVYFRGEGHVWKFSAR